LPFAVNEHKMQDKNQQSPAHTTCVQQLSQQTCKPSWYVSSYL